MQFDMNIDEIRKELASIIGAVKDRMELEKGFGVDVLSLSQQKKNPVTRYSQKPVTEADCTESSDMRRCEKQRSPVAEKERRAKFLEGLRQKMLVCHKCPLDKTRTHLVYGVGNPMANLMFVGEAPGRDEDLQGEPFVGRAGQLLTKIIEAMGMQRSDVYIANILKCRPPGNRNPLPEEIMQCIPYLRKQIDIIQPKILCALGTFAAHTLLNTTVPVSSLRGKFHEYNGIPMMVTFHPAYLLRNPGQKAKVWEDIKKVRDFLKKKAENQE